MAPNRVFKRRPGNLLNPESEPQKVLDQIKANIGRSALQAQYQQNPMDGESEFLSLQGLHFVDTLHVLDVFLCRAQSWDTAQKDGPKSDFSVGLTFGFHAHEECW